MTPSVRVARLAPMGDRAIVAFAIKAEVRDLQAKTFTFVAQKTMYGGKEIATGDTIFVFASENEGGKGLIARGVVTSAEAIARKRGVARQTPRVSVAVKRTALAKRPLGRAELKHFREQSRCPTRAAAAVARSPDHGSTGNTPSAGRRWGGWRGSGGSWRGRPRTGRCVGPCPQ
jgi:hypothetical protein